MKYIYIIWSLIFVTTAAVFTSYFISKQSEAIFPPELPDEISAVSSIKPILPNEANWGTSTITLEESNLLTIQKIVGGTILHRGDAGGSEYSLCYRLSLNGQSGHVWLISGELGGNTHDVNVIYLELDKKNRYFSEKCQNLPQKLQPVNIEGYIGLGQNIGKIKDKLGEPSAQKDNWQFYIHKGQAPNQYERYSVLGLKVHQNKVISLFLSQATTN